MNSESKLRQNIWKNYVYTFLSSLDLTHGTWMIYLAFKGMSLFQLGMLEGIFHVSSFLMEVPTGAVADICGRKISRICGRIASVMFVVILLFSDNFLMFAVSFVFAALSYNLESGAGDALIYDSLKELNMEKSYMKINGIKEAAMNLGGVGGLILGGYLASLDFRYAYIIAACIGVLVILQSLTFTEPHIEMEHIKEKNPFKVVKNQVVGSMEVLRNNKKIGFLIIFSQIIFAFGTTLFFYLQNYMKSNGYSEAKIGVVLAVASLVGAVVATQVYKIERRLKEKGILLIMPVISVLCIWGIAFTKYHYVFFVVMSAVDGIIYITVNDYINKLIPSEKRATIISFSSMVFSFYMIIIFPIVGKIGDMISLELAFKILAIMATILAIINMRFLLNKEKMEVKLLDEKL